MFKNFVGLECHSCVYHKNLPKDWLDELPSSDKDCEKKPKKTEICPEINWNFTQNGLAQNKMVNFMVQHVIY